MREGLAAGFYGFAPLRCDISRASCDQYNQIEYGSRYRRHAMMQSKERRILRYAILLIGLVCGSAGAIGAQTIASSPDPSAGVQYVAPICSGGVRCAALN